MQYHLSDGYETTWGNERANFYGLEYIPTLWFDGAINRVGVYPYSSLHADLEARHALSTDVTLVLSASQPAAGVLTVQALIGVEPGGVGKTMRVQIVQVLDRWPSAGGFHRNGFKQAAAAQIVSLTPGQSQVVERTFTLDTESWADLDHAGIVAWAEANTATLPLTVYQAAALPGPVYPDCNGNRVIDSDDIASGTSPDCNGNGTPDECEIPPLGSPNHDCNGNDVPDDCDLAAATSADCNADGVPDECELVAARGGSFDRFYAWAAFEPRQHGVGADAAGYMGAVFDGRYAYFVPYRTQTAAHGEVLRYDTTATFATAAAWAAYDPGAHGVGTDADGYNGAAFDGRHIYFAPYNNGTAYHGEVLRLDTAAPVRRGDLMGHV